MRRPSFLFTAACLLFGSLLHAAGLSGVVKDPSGALVGGASVTAEGGEPKVSLQALSDVQGRFHFDDLKPGSYAITVTRDGFDTWDRKVAIAGKPIDLAVSLKLKILTTSVQVSGKRSSLANSDPNYQALRGGKLTKVYRVENLVLTRDVGKLTFRSGSFSFLPPVLGHVTTGVFVGDGNFQMTPAFDMAAKHMHRIAGVDSVDEDFSALVVWFTDATFDEIKQHSELADESPQRHEEAFQRVKHVVESRLEPPSPLFRGPRPNPLTMLQRLLNYEDIPNYEAEVLAELYNPARTGSFRAFLHGKKHADLRFLVNPSGAMPMLSAPEEVALLNYDPSSETDGIWYLSHFATELNSGHASSNEDKRLIAPEQYQMDVWIGKDNLIGKDPGIAVTCNLRFHSHDEGTRMVKFDLVPDLQVQRVSWNGKEIPFVQESRKQDGSFYLQMPEPLVKDLPYQITFEYTGGEIVTSMWGTPSPRRAWYPRPYGDNSRATYDLTFRTPHGTTIVSVGKQVKHGPEGAFDVSEWRSDVPIQVAAFKYLGQYFGKTKVDEVTNIDMGVYMDASVTRPIPPPKENILIDEGNSLRVFDAWFGPPAYKSISVMVGRSTDSMPSLVFASPVIVAGFTSLYTQSVLGSGGRGGRGQRGPALGGGGIPGTVQTYLDEAFPREVSRQWWGNTVGSVSFHDEWLSSGFANFSTSLYDLAAYLKPDEFRDHWVKAREYLVNNNRFGIRPVDVGPLWLGVVNDSYKTMGIGNLLSTYKGGYVLHMLRCLMLDPETREQDFRAMMQDYVRTFANHAVSTEDFKWLVEKHMKPAMDLGGNHKMDWFFHEWVYGTDIPSYHLEYSIDGEKGQKPVLHGKLTQSGVSPEFVMRVPIYAEFEGRKLLIGAMGLRGNTTGDLKATLPEMPKNILLNVNHDVLTDKQEVRRTK